MIDALMTGIKLTPSYRAGNKVTHLSIIQRDGKPSAQTNWVKYAVNSQMGVRDFGKYPFNILTEEIYGD